ncbi:MepB family protein [Legionella sainthelensi]|uniref:MepB family protein n=1 Tax=Legionella sainthelensi TaxID=28087 RepID=UPI000E20273B|nr:MepB family protein [Legionella sainthelensi]
MLPHPDFSLATQIAYIPSGLYPSLIKIEEESVEYGALTFTLDDKLITFRTGKITPTKPGFFVTLWQRVNGLTKPHHITDSSDFFVISVHDNIGFGQFIFHKSVLLQHSVISSDSEEGKRGVRLYPPWIKNLNKQAKRSQDWQCKHFINFESNISVKYRTLINAFKNH